MPDERMPEEGSEPRDRLEASNRAVTDALDRREAEARKSAEREAQVRVARREGAAWRVVTDLIAATAVGSLIGFVLDRTIDSTPFGLIVGLFAGFGLGMWRAAKSAARLQAQANSDQHPMAPPPAAAPGAGDADKE
ncbi:MAG: AtpZ/AtpI family protein [Caulobacterales bacterium]|jgi:ATP synthase protein I